MTTFRKLRGANVAALLFGASLIGGEAAADQVIPDDLIVQGSECVGLDCVNNENFGFDTIKLKENNLRIFFEDTSSSPGFPTNDWRLIANDSASGGANFFAIEDATAARQVFRVTAGAQANSIFVDSTSRVGLRTSTPVLDLHIRTGNTPAHRLEQDNSNGWGAQTWDVAGNEANFFVRDVTGGSRLPFRIRPGAPTSSIDIAANGNVGIGTATPQLSLHANSSSTGGTALALANGSTGGAAWSLLSSGSGNSEGAGKFSITTGFLDARVMTFTSGGNVGIGETAPAAQLHTTGGVRFAGVANCAAGIVSNANGDLACMASSRQFKHVAGELAPAVALVNIMALRPQVGSYKATPNEPEHWLIAEEAAAVDPALVGLKDGKPYTVKTQNVVADLVAVIQQQQRRIEALERAIAR